MEGLPSLTATALKRRRLTAGVSKLYCFFQGNEGRELLTSGRRALGGKADSYVRWSIHQQSQEAELGYQASGGTKPQGSWAGWGREWQSSKIGAVSPCWKVGRRALLIQETAGGNLSPPWRKAVLRTVPGRSISPGRTDTPTTERPLLCGVH